MNGKRLSHPAQESRKFSGVLRRITDKLKVSVQSSNYLTWSLKSSYGRNPLICHDNVDEWNDFKQLIYQGIDEQI